MDPSFISVLTNCYYGGKLANFPSKKAEFTATEERIIEIVSDGISRSLESAWKDLMPVSIKNVGIVYGCQSPHLKTMHSEASVQKAWFNGHSKIISEVFLNNGNAAYKKEVWLENKFDEKLTGLEDIDLGKKAKANNWEIFYCAEANVEHLHRESFKTIQNRYRREAEAMKNINKDLKSDVHIIKNTFFHCFKGFLRGVRYDIKTSKDSLQPNSDIISILKYRFSQYVGTYKGYKNDMSKNKMTDLYFYPPKL